MTTTSQFTKRVCKRGASMCNMDLISRCHRSLTSSFQLCMAYDVQTHASSACPFRAFGSSDLAEAQWVLRILLPGTGRPLRGITDTGRGVGYGASCALGRFPHCICETGRGVAESFAGSSNCSGSVTGEKKRNPEGSVVRTSVSSSVCNSTDGLPCSVGHAPEDACFDRISIVYVYAGAVGKSELLADGAAGVCMGVKHVCETRTIQAANCVKQVYREGGAHLLLCP